MKQLSIVILSLALLVGNVAPARCTAREEAGIKTTGEVYVADGGEMMRGDFGIGEGAEAIEAHILRRDGWHYLWGSFLPTGIKVRVTAADQETMFGQSNASFVCREWTPEPGRFALPAGVSFLNFSF